MNYRQDVVQFISEKFLFGEELVASEDASLRDSGIIDSTGLIELVAFVEKKFDIRVADQDVTVENFDSVRGLTRFIQRKMRS